VKILLLGGTGEGRVLAKSLQDLGHDVLSSLAGATRAPTALAGRIRTGGFGGEDGFRDVIAAEAPDLVLDATHPFAARISARTAAICAEIALPYLQILRDPWVEGPGDRWAHIDAEEDAFEHIEAGSRVFLATGRQTLDRFAGMPAAYFYCRQIDPPEQQFPFPNGQYVIGRPPFSEDQEVALFQKLRINWLVVKNSGGQASRSKLDAARALTIPVLLIKRPTQPDAARVSTVADALNWIAGNADH
jgi:precorrin-6A/cobalt-precorrin-6A reductase